MPLNVLLLQGVVHGFTGVVTKPMEGAKQEGVGGFFKGVSLLHCFSPAAELLLSADDLIFLQ